MTKKLTPLHRLATLLLRNTKSANGFNFGRLSKNAKGECWHTRVTIEYKSGQPPRTFYFTARQLKEAEGSE